MAEKYILFNLDDDKSKKLGDVISNSTCKKIAAFLAEKEASETDIAKELGLPVNTTEYNLKKLLEAGIIEKSKNFLWSQKGKKIPNYKIANKLIVISPKKTLYSKLNSIIPVVIIAGILTALLGWYNRLGRDSNEIMKQAYDNILTEPATIGQVENTTRSLVNSAFSVNPVLWFATGAIIVLIIFLAWNWKKL